MEQSFHWSEQKITKPSQTLWATSFRYVAWIISSFHYFVDHPRILQGWTFLSWVFTIMATYHFPTTTKMVVVTIFTIVLTLVLFQDRLVTGYLRTAIFLICHILPPQDCTKDPAIQRKLTRAKIFQKPEKRKGVLITGVTGFTGIHLFDLLYKKTDLPIYCLIRGCATRTLSINKVMKTVKNFGVSLTPEMIGDKRVTFIPGNFKHQEIGLSEESKERIASEVEFIFHNAAALTYAIPYEILRGPWIDNLSWLSQFCFEKDISLNVMGSILGRTPKTTPDRRSFWCSGYARVNLVKELMMQQYYAQGLRGTFTEVGFITCHSEDLQGRCQTKNPVLAMLCIGVDINFPGPHHFNSVPVDKLVKCMFETATNPDFQKYRYVLPTTGNVSPEYTKKIWNGRPVIRDVNEYVDKAAEFGWRRMYISHLITEVPFPTPLPDATPSDLARHVGLTEDLKELTLKRSEIYGRSDIKKLLKNESFDPTEKRRTGVSRTA